MYIHTEDYLLFNIKIVYLLNFSFLLRESLNNLFSFLFILFFFLLRASTL